AGPAGADEGDSLDAFMGGLKEEINKPVGDSKAFEGKAKASWEELQSDDPAASYLEACEDGTLRGGMDEAEGSDEEGAKAEPMDE
ncbi:unnamed protein product, partial [Prorocentrum cordatum]